MGEIIDVAIQSNIHSRIESLPEVKYFVILIIQV